MRKINYSLIISDFDGTLVCDDGNITEENKKAIAEYIENGGSFAISTGRMHYGILPRAKELGLKGAVSCCQGAIIMDIESGNTLLSGVISHEVTLKICKKMEELGVHYHVYAFEDYYCNMDDEALHWYEKVVRVKAKRITDRPLSEYVAQKGICAYKVLAMVAPEDNAKTMQLLAKETFEGCCLTKSSDVLVEVINASYSKGTAVEFLAEYYGASPEKVIAVGDQQNDIPMLKKAGLGIAVKNADAETRKNALVFDYTNEESAVAKIIETYGYTKE